MPLQVPIILMDTNKQVVSSLPSGAVIPFKLDLAEVRILWSLYDWLLVLVPQTSTFALTALHTAEVGSYLNALCERER